MTDKWIIRTSDRLDFKRCRTRWDWGSKLRSNLEAKKEPRELAFGTSVHVGMQANYEPSTWGLPWEERQLLAVTGFVAKWREYYGKVAIDDETWDLDLELGKGMIANYCQEHRNDPEHLTPIKVEIEFEVPIILGPEVSNRRLPSHFYLYNLGNGTWHLYYKGLPVYYQGRIDCIWQDKDGRYWVVDFKTAKKFDDTDWLALDEQCGSYMWAIQQMLGIRLAGTVYVELRKDVPHEPALLKPTKKIPIALSRAKDQNTTYVIYQETLDKLGLPAVEYADILEHLKEQGNKFFRHTRVMRTQRELKSQGERIFHEAVDMLNDPSIYPNPSKWNCGRCPFFMACVSKHDGSEYQYILDDKFQLREETTT